MQWYAGSPHNHSLLHRLMFASLIEEEADVATADEDENLMVLSFLLADTYILLHYICII
jgi:hypothetical protein